ncbi:threonine export protein RhtC [Dyella nitratireducens]|uniref:Threonine efflux protein n=1 Tax=Dyella nitratireducens TaxID=1849580 RepID=A0ABQ1GTS7_9GAMM|nr:threonine export protein RhtC [Dyella nitratireducens]GGA50260.1 threonine efflux protein [Dyella nitratireducens]GLQ42562.1 threonine export protein RhtC [Dyella nitratireducens]
MSLFITIAIVHIIALMSPGPDFFFVSQTAVSRSRHEAMAGVAGITLGVAMWAALALLGLQLLLHKLIWLERLISIGGGLYLCWMGFKMLRGALAKPVQTQAEPVQVFAGAWRSLRNGLLTNLANPKVVIYFGSIFSAFVGEGVSSTARWGLWAMVVAETFLWFSFVAGCFALPVMRRGYLRISRWIDGCAGAVFMLFGLHLIFSRRAA